MEIHINQQEPHIVRPDSKGRITLGSLADGVSSYHVITKNDGRIVLEPYAEIPQREMWLLNNKEALYEVLQGIEDVAQGRVYDLGDFTKYIENEDGDNQ